MNKIKKIIISCLTIAVSVGMVCTGSGVVYAEDDKKLDDKDYSDTTLKRSVDSLEIDVQAITDMKNFNSSPLYDVENNELLLPRIDGHKVEIFGSDNKPTISLTGEVTRPLTTQSVKLLYKITNETDKTSITTETNAVVKIPGKEINVVGDNKKPTVIPGIREWVGGSGKINLASSRIVLGTSKFSKAVAEFKEDYEDLTGRSISIVNGNQDSLNNGDIYIGEAKDESMLGDEGYYMNIGGSEANENYIEILATHNTGALYGGVSILQILKQDSGRNDLPRGLAKDYPLFEQRGMMFDVARKWVPMSYLKDLSKQMSWYKLNMLSLHLSDNDIWNSLSTDNGTEPKGWFRLQSEAFPELTSPEHYTKDEFRKFQSSSMGLGIDIIPELDTPGHALSYTKAWPDCALPGNAKYLDVTNPKTLENTKKLFSEYINGFEGGEATFIGKHVNIGTDEYKVNGSVQKEGFRKYCNDLLEYVNSTGKEAVFWGSLKENSGTTEVTTDAVMFAWFQGYADAKQSLDAGYNIISMEDNEVYIVPGGGYYSNQFGRAEHLYNNWLPNNNSGWAGRPAPDGHPRVNGGQFAVWNDFHGNGISVNDISYRIQHNLYATAIKCWNGNQTKNEGYSYSEINKLASTLGDAPRADFMYEIDKKVVKNELVKLDDKVLNGTVKGTGAEILNKVNITENVSGKNGNAIQFNGDSSYISTDLKSSGFDWTAAMWIKPDVDNPNDTILMEGETGKLRLDGGKIKYDVENYTHIFDCNIQNNQWTHITLTGTYEGVSLYINGVLVDTLVGKPFPNYNINSGCNSWNGSYPVNGDGQKTQRYYQTLMLPMETLGSQKNAVKATIDEFNVFNTVLTKEQIKQLAGITSYENLALHKTVASSGNENASFAGSNVVDGNTTATRWSSNYDDAAWLTIDLGKKYNVNNIKIFWEAAYAKKYQIKVSEDNTNWDMIVYNEQDGKGGTTNIKFDMKENIQYVKFQGEERAISSGGFSFFEMEVYGDKVYDSDKPKQNVALNKSVEVSYYNTASTEGDRSGSKAVDGSLDTRWEFLLNNTTENFIQIPLNSDEDVSNIIIKQMVWGGANRIKKIRITSLTGETETEVLTLTDYTPGTTDNGNKIDTKKIDLGRVVKADAIKIYLTPKLAGVEDLVNIREVEVYGTKEFEEPSKEDVERNHKLIPQSTMSATATSEHPNVGSEGLASMAIDGNSGTWWHTNWNDPKPLPQSITIDLHDLRAIGKYTCLPRSGAGNGTISQYKLEISTDGSNYKIVSEGTWGVNAELKVVEFAPEVARYVRLTATQGVGGFASAAEINVYQTDAANETDLQNLIQQIESIDLSGYLESSKAKLDDELAKAKALLNDTKKRSISIEDIKLASKGLQEGLMALDVAGNKDKLQQAYDSYEDKKATQYVVNTFKDFSESLEKAKKIIGSSDEVGQKTIDSLINEMKNKANSLIDLTNLRAYIDNAKVIDLVDASQVTSEELNLKLANAITIEGNDNATLNQVEIAVYRLSIAIDELKPDAKALQELIDRTKEAAYTTDSWNAFVPTLEAAKAILTTKYSMNDLKTNRLTLERAKLDLQLRADDESVSKLQEFIDAYLLLNTSDYTEDSWQEYTQMINKAKDLLNDISNVDQLTMNQIINSIETYVLVPSKEDNTTKERLVTLIHDYETHKSQYTVSSWKTFEKILNKVKDYLTIADNEVMEKGINELIVASKELQLRGDTSHLESVINQYQVNASSYTKESYDTFVEKLNIAKNAIKDASDLTQKQINQIEKDVMTSFDELKEIKIPVIEPVEKPEGLITSDNTNVIPLVIMGILAIGALIILNKRNKQK